MKKIVQILLISLLAIQSIFSQPSQADLQRQLDELKFRIKTLESENETIKTAAISRDSADYCSMRSEIFTAFSNLPQLDFDFKSTTDKISVTSIFTKLMQACNPTSDILGFRFADIIFTSAERNFLPALKDERDRRRFSHIMCKIIDNPIVSSLANSNPITSVVAAIISTIAGFTTSQVDVEKDGGRIKDVSLEQKDAFDNHCIMAFREELQVYIDFYDAMLKVSKNYQDGLTELEEKYAFLIQSVNDYKTGLYHEIRADEFNILLKLAVLLPDPATIKVDYDQLLTDAAIRKCLEIAGNYPGLKSSVTAFKQEYNDLLLNFLTGYRAILETSASFPDQNIDQSKTQQLIADINDFIGKQMNNE